ncbi:uncharacterized protein DUF3761 [Nocardia tenerifensis]|uniref:Uncharacterized protein DUF3761 n=1 Tax=Nocardia tenerifensis TaxID=228006 RepID=A0A318KCU5_9NOCA|nr:DUF3761 domain-containing protein [Nocardia tenerifensis]PXX56454.1 uncharacterized protein DUF3761 [Nocardia tenerifensis]
MRTRALLAAFAAVAGIAALISAPASATPILHAACPSGQYENIDQRCVPRPREAVTPPVGATARCVDGAYSYSRHRSGSCSGHKGVAEWLVDLPS